MCNPVIMAVGSFAISAAQGVMEYSAGVDAYNENEQYRVDNIKRSNANAIRMYSDTQRRMIQEQDAAAAETAELGREARAARATAEVAAGEAGVSGLSVDALLADLYGREASYRDNILTNRDWTLEQLNNEMYGIRANAEDRNNSVRKMSKPSLFATGLKIAGAGIDAYGSYRSMTT